MKYLLGFSFFYKHFKGKFDIKIFSDKQLIDTIVLDKDIESKIKDKTKTVEKYADSIAFGRYFEKQATQICENEYCANYLTDHPAIGEGCVENKMPERIWVYEIDEEALGDAIRFEIDDSNSNYTNGFMTKSNLFMIDNVFLFPKKFFTSKIKLIKLGKFNYKNWPSRRKAITRLPDTQHNIVAWPGNGFVRVGDKMTIHTWMGGDQKIHIPLLKKFHTFILHPKKNLTGSETVEFCFNKRFLDFDAVYDIINTYDED